MLKIVSNTVVFILCLLGSVSAISSESAVISSVSLYEAAEMPEMSAILNVQEKKLTFFDFLSPIVFDVNQKIQAERAWLKVIEVRIKRGESLAAWQDNLLLELAEYYNVDEEPGSNAFFIEMYKRVDTIPASLALAQAANESAWGTSRFAVEGNNLFGQWCFTKGCGLVPSGRDNDARHEVKKFQTVRDSVSAYIRNLNTHHQYQSLRQIRSELRYLSLPIDSTYLVWGLEGYSIRGVPYIRELIDMIQHNDLQHLDHPSFYAKNEIKIRFD